MLEYSKLQIGCMLVILYIAFIYLKDNRCFDWKRRLSAFDVLLVLGIGCVLFDGITAYTVNHLETVDEKLNRFLHLCFLLSLDSFIFWQFVYMISSTSRLPKNIIKKVLLYGPFLFNVVIVVWSIDTLEYRQGEISNYSMGLSAYTCFGMAGIYLILTLIRFFGRWRDIEKNKRVSIFTYLFCMSVIAVYQMLRPQALMTSIGITITIVGIYMHQENLYVSQLEQYHNEMIMGFATLVENKDGSTGGHIKRTTGYVRLLAWELRRREYNKRLLTKNYIKKLCMAAPMHDIGKISIPDGVLQKPGRLTEKEFEIIKRHSVNGGKIVQETFGHLADEQYTQIAYDVARFHHEKWNGKGYPEGRKGYEIPLSARIMAIADVFDALSQKRCYKEAMPLEQCFRIIKEGSGTDFDPDLVKVFLDIKEQVIRVYTDNQNKK